jgi:hypothetical protein
MSARLAVLATRRRALGEQSRILREALGADAVALSRRFRAADRLISVARSGTARALLIGAATLVVVGRPRRILALAIKVLALWPFVSTVLPRIRTMFGEPKASA